MVEVVDDANDDVLRELRAQLAQAVASDARHAGDDVTFDAFCELESWAADAALQFSDEPAK